MPPSLVDCRPLVVRLTPDHSTSAGRIVKRIRQNLAGVTGQAIELAADSDPGEALDDLVRATANRGLYIVLVIERFQSFARLANTATVSFLSQLRSLEHEPSLTTVLISAHDCPTIRRRLPPEIAFVNSAYGDNHDHAIMPPLTMDEFESSAPHIERSDIPNVFSIGAGPDAVFAALIDESRQGLADLHDRTWRRAGASLEAFARDLLGQIGVDEIALFEAALDGSLDKVSLAHLRSLPLSGFLFNLELDPSERLKGKLARTFAQSVIPIKTALPSSEPEVTLPDCSVDRYIVNHVAGDVSVFCGGELVVGNKTFNFGSISAGAVAFDGSKATNSGTTIIQVLSRQQVEAALSELEKLEAALSADSALPEDEKRKALTYLTEAKNDPSPSKIGKVVECIGFLGTLAEAGMALAPYATALGAIIGLR